MKLISLTFTTGLLVTQLACGMSPQFHHAEPNRNQPYHGNSTREGTCHFYFKSKNLCATLTWVKTPTQSDAGEFKLMFWDKAQGSSAGDPVAIQPEESVQVRLWMPDMGHRGGMVTVTPLNDGSYDVTNVDFTMPGHWEIQIELKNRNGELVDQAALGYDAQ